MAHVCPWWGGYFIDNPLRRLLHNPQRLLAPYVRPGMSTMDVGCGMGIFTIAMAELVGPGGQVLAVDLQPQMLAAVRRRAEKAGVAERVRIHACEPNRLGVAGPVDFALAFAMVHEVPDQRRLLEEICACLRSGGKLLIAEPIIHVPKKDFAATVATAEALGLSEFERPRVRLCHAVALAKP